MMGVNILAVLFAVVVIGGLNSLLGAIVAGISLGVIEGLTKVFYPEASSTVVFIVMVIVLLIRPAGLFGTVVQAPPSNLEIDTRRRPASRRCAPPASCCWRSRRRRRSSSIRCS